MTMKVLMAADFPRSLREMAGGTWAAAHNLVEALIRYTDATVLTVTFRTDISAPEKLLRHGGRLEIRQYPLGRYRSLINHVGQRLQFRRVVREWRPEVVHAQGEGLYASLAVHSGRPNLYTIHGVRLKELEMQRRQLGPVRYHLWARSIREHHRKATNIVAINRYTRDAVSKLHNAHVWDIPNAVRQDLFNVGTSRDGSGRGAVLLVGGVRKRKDIMTAIATIKALCDRQLPVRLDIVGPNDDKPYLESVNNRLREYKLEECVTIHGLVDDNELRKRYECADVLLLTSLEESSPICIVEAMASGLPIVATDVGGIAEMVNGNALLCKPGDVNGLVEALATALFDQSAGTRMGQLSREIARSKWSAEAVARATYHAYKEIVRGG